MMDLSIKELARATGALLGDATEHHQHTIAAMRRFEITTPRRVAAYLANVSIETARLSKMEEDLFYRDAMRLASIYPRAFKTVAEAEPYVKNSRGLDNLLYQGYRGRGHLMLTWKRNYEAASKALGFDYVGQPGLVAQPQHAALTGAWFFATNGCNQAADKGDIDDVRRRINGPRRLHVLEVAKLYGETIQWTEVA